MHEKEILAEFDRLLAIPNVASDTANIERNAKAIAAMLVSRGLAVRVLRLEGASPLVVGDLRGPGAKRTVAFYAHYDGQPVDETQWKHAPWDPIVRDRSGSETDWRTAASIDPEARIFVRSAGDDKAAIIAMVAALDTLHASGIKPSVNLRFVFEGEEEAGSPHLDAYLAKDPEAIRPLVERHIEEQGYTIVHETPDAAARMTHPKLVKLEWGPGYAPARTPLALPLSREVATLMAAAGKDPVLLPTVGGSIPMYLFQQPENRPVIGLPIANHDDNQHAPDENLRLQNLWDGIEIYAALFGGLRGK